MISAIDSGGTKTKAIVLNLSGSLTVEPDKIAIVIGDATEEHLIRFDNGELVITDTNKIPAVTMNDEGYLVYSLPDGNDIILLLFEKEEQEVPSVLASIIKSALASGEATVPTEEDKPADQTVEVPPSDFVTEDEISDSAAIQIKFNGQMRTGSYEGQKLNSLPHGQGTFVSDDLYPKFSYTGNWKNGEMYLSGELEDEGYVIHFDTSEGEYDVTGYYKGPVWSGVPNGIGYFEVRDSKGGITWTYTGKFTAGEFNGPGTQEWPSENKKYSGTFKNGEFVPENASKSTSSSNNSPTEWADILVKIGQNLNFKVNQKSIDFLNAHSNLFTIKLLTSSSSVISSSYMNKSWKLANFKKNPSQYCDKLILVENLSIIQVFSSEISGLQYEFCLMEDNEGTIYYGFFEGSTSLTEDTKVSSIYLLPLDWPTYKTTMGNDRWAVFCAYTKIYSIISSIGKVRINYGDSPNVRSQPSVSSTKIGSALSGNVYELLDISGTWYKIKLDDGTIGWIAGGMATIIEQF